MFSTPHVMVRQYNQYQYSQMTVTQDQVRLGQVRSSYDIPKRVFYFNISMEQKTLSSHSRTQVIPPLGQVRLGLVMISQRVYLTVVPTSIPNVILVMLSFPHRYSQRANPGHCGKPELSSLRKCIRNRKSDENYIFLKDIGKAQFWKISHTQ